MIDKRDIDSAIKDCEAEPLTASKLDRLAHLYIVRGYLFDDREQRAAYAVPTNSTTGIVCIDDDTEFGRAINGKSTIDAWRVMGELVDALEVLHPKLHSSLLKKLREI